MKRWSFVVMIAAVILFCTACHSPRQTEAESLSQAVDVDLTTLSGTMVYAEVYNMMMTPEEYAGKVLRITGTFVVAQDPESRQVSCGVIIQDAMACCAQGFEIIMPEQAVYPDDYPPADTQVTVVGTLQIDRTMEEHGVIFLRLQDVTFESSNQVP